MRLFFDHDSLDSEVLRMVEEMGHDFTTSALTQHGRASDEAILQFASGEGRIVYSANKVDFARIHARWMREDRQHAGIIVRSVQQLAPHLQARGIAALASEIGGSRATNQLFFLENFL